MIGDAAQYEGLVRLYGEFGDKELIALGRNMADLTETAQEALKAEIARRGISLTPEPVAVEVAEDEEEDSRQDLAGFAASAPPECVFEFEDGISASAAYLALADAGIESIALGRQSTQRGPRVVVAPGDAARAAALLSQPVEERFRAEAETPQDFFEPVCPECGAQEAMLEAVEPTNQWRCDACDHGWAEAE